MTIEITEKIDIVTINEYSGRIYLNISDHLGWEIPNKLLLLQQKVNRYLAFIESGEMHWQHPQSTQLNPFIMLICLHPPKQSGLKFLAQITEIIEEAGYSFGWQRFDPKQSRMS